MTYLEVVTSIACNHSGLLHLHAIYHMQQVNMGVLLLDRTVTKRLFHSVVFLRTYIGQLVAQKYVLKIWVIEWSIDYLSDLVQLQTYHNFNA